MLKKLRQFRAVVIPAGLFVLALAVDARADEYWQPIPPEELALEDDPLNPGAPAITLYRETFSNHEESFERHHYRIKILSSRGAEYGNVEIPYIKGQFRVEDIRARTVQPDGTTMVFDGPIYDKTILRTRKVRGFAKTLTLPAVEAGCIVEYIYALRGLIGQGWIIQDELSMRRVRLSVKPFSLSPFQWAVVGVEDRNLWRNADEKDAFDALHRRPNERAGALFLELKNVPPFQQEEFMPPESAVRTHVQFFYPADFRTVEGEIASKRVEKLIGKDKRIRRAASETVSSNDAPMTQLRKLYSLAQRIRNLSYEATDTERRRGREAKAKDVLVRGYGSAVEINRLFVALVRAAGFDGSIVRLAPRDRTFFAENDLDVGNHEGGLGETPLQSKLALVSALAKSAEVVRVRSGPEDIFLDPGTIHTPFGLLSWEQTDVVGVELGAGLFIKTPKPVSSDARTERKATLRLTPDGTLEGKGHVAFHGQEALQHRLRAFEKDDPARREQLEEELKVWLPADSTVEIDGIEHWETPEEPLRVEFTVEAPGFASTAGLRLVVPAGILRGAREVNFQHESRVHPVYFPHPWEEHDEILLRVPAGYVVEGVPEPRRVETAFGEYEASWEANDEGVLARRRLMLSQYFYPVREYPNLRRFFSEVRAGDEQQIVLVSTEPDETRP